MCYPATAILFACCVRHYQIILSILGPTCPVCQWWKVADLLLRKIKLVTLQFLGCPVSLEALAVGGWVCHFYETLLCLF